MVNIVEESSRGATRSSPPSNIHQHLFILVHFINSFLQSFSLTFIFSPGLSSLILTLSLSLFPQPGCLRQYLHLHSNIHHPITFTLLCPPHTLPSTIFTLLLYPYLSLSLHFSHSLSFPPTRLPSAIFIYTSILSIHIYHIHFSFPHWVAFGHSH